VELGLIGDGTRKSLDGRRRDPDKVSPGSDKWGKVNAETSPEGGCGGVGVLETARLKRLLKS